MAWYQANIGSGEGRLEETTLWENSSPTSDFSAKTVTLLQGMSNFNFVKIYWYGNSATISYGSLPEECGEVIIPISNFISKTTTNSVRRAKLIIGGTGSGSATAHYSRRVSYVSDTQIDFTAATAWGGTGSSNASCIPYKISGLK